MYHPWLFVSILFGRREVQQKELCKISLLLFAVMRSGKFGFGWWWSSSLCHAISIDIRDPLSPPLPIVYCFRQVLKSTSRICTELPYVGSSWTSCLCSFMWRGPQEYITYELVPTYPAMDRMSASSNFDSFRDGWSVALQLLLCGVLSPGLDHYCSQHSCVITVKLFLHAFS